MGAGGPTRHSCRAKRRHRRDPAWHCVEDPFRPLEDPTRADVQAWIAAQDRQARALLESNPVHARVLAFLQTSNRYQRSGGMRRIGRSLVSWAFDGTKEQSWLEIREAIADPGRPLIDPNTMGPDGSVSLWSIYPDRLATKVAYLTAETGGDALVLRIRDIRSGGVDLLDRLEGCPPWPGCRTATPSTTCARRSPPSPRSWTAAAITFSTISWATRSPPIAWSGASRAEPTS
jgi:hypothetical protein